MATISHPPGGRLPLLSASCRTSPPLGWYQVILLGEWWLVTEAHKCERLAQNLTLLSSQVGFAPTTCLTQVWHSTHCATEPPRLILSNIYWDHKAFQQYCMLTLSSRWMKHNPHVWHSNQYHDTLVRCWAYRQKMVECYSPFLGPVYSWSF